MSENHTSTDASDEIDLKELFFSIWAYKGLIAIITGAFILSAGYYSLTADKLYSASSTFVLESPDRNGGLLSSLGGDLGALAALSGVSGGAGNSGAALIERTTSREFVLEVADELKLRDDIFFNAYDPTANDPLWKSTIKSILGMKKKDSNPVKIADWNVIQSYNEFVRIEATKSGSIQVSVEHENPERATEIANHIVDKIIAMTKIENIEAIDERLGYLSGKLADASENLEGAQSALKEYSLSNSTQAIESFAAGSVLLDDMRAQRDRSLEQLSAIVAIKDSLSSRAPTQQDYFRLRETYPLLDQSAFRRMLGLSEVISAWTWPSLSGVIQVENSIRDRIASLGGEIAKLESDALRYATSSEELARLTRELKVAEATYTVLLEQVRSQSLVAGYTQDNSKIIEIADVPIGPSKPKRSLIIALGLVLGVFFSSAVALVLSSRKAVYNSTSSLLAAAGARAVHKIESIRSFRNKDLKEIAEFLSKVPVKWARQVTLECDGIANRDPVILVDISGANSADTTGRIIAATAGQLDRNVALIDLSRFSQASDKDLEPAIDGTLATLTESGAAREYVYLAGNQNVDILFSKSLKHILGNLSQKHERILLCVNSDVLDTVLSSTAIQDPNYIAILGKGKTRAATLQDLRSRGNIEVALYE